MESAQWKWERGVVAATLFLVASSALAVAWQQRHQTFRLAKVGVEAQPVGRASAQEDPANEAAASGGAAAEPGARPGPATSAVLPGSKRAAEAKPRPVDVNRAGVEELTALPGIGPVLARRVVEQRQKRGWYKKVEDLLEVPGIGPKVLEKIRPWVRLGEQVASLEAVPSLAAGEGAPAP
ncbi:MAG: helix-hairpin-helix domain-containing protein [Bacillota bacterium]|nr:helix-hairpin-helix domain-containing protein [Bacillota bacterium]